MSGGVSVSGTGPVTDVRGRGAVTDLRGTGAVRGVSGTGAVRGGLVRARDDDEPSWTGSRGGRRAVGGRRAGR
nr:hypothetical protein StreXyl84_25340 [Streptomyces sp. Xyl84]